MKPKVRPSVGDVYAVPLRRGWGACQVIRAAQPQYEVLSFDHYSDARPTLDEVAVRGLTVDHHYWTSELDRLNVKGAPPPEFVHLGTAPLAPHPSKPCNAYGHWLSLGLQTELQHRWNALPDALRRAFRDSQERRAMVTVKLTSGDVQVPESESELFLAFGPHTAPGALNVPEGEPFDFEQLSQLHGLLQLTVFGEAPGLIEWMRSRPILEALVWHDLSAHTIDLTGTNLSTVAIEGAGVRSLSLPRSVEALTLDTARDTRWTVHADAQGANLSLTLRSLDGEGMGALRGLERVRSLTVTDFDSLDLATIADAFDLHTLTLYGRLGTLTHSDALARLKGLKTFHCWRCLHVDAEHMPPLTSWPSLEQLWVVEALDTEAGALKTRYGRDKRVSVRTARTAGWARHHAGHPFLRWRNGRLRGPACIAYASASKKVDDSAGDPSRVRAAMVRLLKAIQKAHIDHGPLSPNEARDVETVWLSLLARVTPPIAPEESDGWMASIRDGW